MKIYTKTGDGGETGLFRGPRVPKHHPRVEAYGNVDELNALVGVTIAGLSHPEIRQLLSSIQNDLFDLGADLATPPQEQEDPDLRIPPEMTARLEKEIDHYEAALAPLNQFILPGGAAGSALLHYARTVCRRTERSLTRLVAREPINPETVRYLNRLSDLLFVLARALNQTENMADVLWKKRRT